MSANPEGQTADAPIRISTSTSQAVTSETSIADQPTVHRPVTSR